MILTDRHHADLLYSTQRLFSDRLGMPAFVPVGIEWWDEGYWRFGESLGDQRLAVQYLIPHEGIWQYLGDGVYETFDTAHPDRAIHGITLAKARDSFGWTHVMPTVQENAEGFARFAAEHRPAKFLYQVGNVGQQIPWHLDPLLLSSTELDTKGRGVTYHQELSGVFHFSEPPVNPFKVRNFVNLLLRLPGYEGFLQAERLLPEFCFTCHGHEGRDGNINPVGAVAQLMQSAGWGWQDKPVGDGFGHVIHAWAAVGRPLIGHARYYRGKLAEPFWQHGTTAIDLDQVSIPEAAEMVRTITNDRARHDGMCSAIRAEFDRLVDYDAEAEAVKNLLRRT